MVRNLRDSVPKAIGYYLLHQFRQKVQFQINQELQNPKIIDEMLKEPPHIREERNALKAQNKIV